jgi:Flp pilus assembly protein TadG
VSWRPSISGPRSRTGQILPLFALFLIALLAVAALAIDVSRAYAERRMDREIADASALAGAQDLQTNTRAITTTNQTQARADAYAVVAARLGGGSMTADPCNGNVSDFSLDVDDCVVPGTAYRVSIKTPSPTCVTCDPLHAIQVTVRVPQFSLTFARVLGVNTWNVGATSVGGLAFQSKYALLTLRPSDILKNGLDKNKDDINLAGTGTRLNILQGDVGTNTYVVTNAASLMTLANGYFIEHVDDITPDGWNKDITGTYPMGKWIGPNLIPDPAYQYPPRTNLPVYANQAAGLRGVLPLASCVGAPATLPAKTECYKPGIYSKTLTVGGSGPGAYFEPGVYFLDGGLKVTSGTSVWGGLTSNAAGVVFVVPQTQGFDLGSAKTVLINSGDATCSSDTCRASPALDGSGNPVKTPGDYTLSIMVTRDTACYTGQTPQLCADTGNNTVKLAGNSGMTVAGVIYAPSDRVNINANFTNQTGVVGQIISWTVDYAGQATLNQEYPGGIEVGAVRLDAACTVPSTPCNNP